MINNQGTESKHSSILILDGSLGIKKANPTSNGIHQVFAETRVRWEVVGVGGGNVVAMEGSIRGSSTWTSLSTITGNTQAVADVSTYDYIRFNVTTASGTGAVISSGFLSFI